MSGRLLTSSSRAPIGVSIQRVLYTVCGVSLADTFSERLIRSNITRGFAPVGAVKYAPYAIYSITRNLLSFILFDFTETTGFLSRRIQLMPDERRALQTKQKKKTCNPFYDENFVYQVSIIFVLQASTAASGPQQYGVSVLTAHSRPYA